MEVVVVVVLVVTMIITTHRYALGVAHEQGVGCDVDEACALRSYKASAMLGCAAAQYRYALLLAKSHGCNQR